MESMNPSAEDIIATLRANEAILREHGITHAALFGSRARGDNRPDSDIDILIETRPDAVHTIYDYAGIKLLIEDLFSLRTDVVNRAYLKSCIRPVAEQHLIHAF
jgi:predicted nucleotidyltransferase